MTTQSGRARGEGLGWGPASRVKIDRARDLRRNPTAAEAALWRVLRRRKHRFIRQFVIEGFIVDFVCRRARLVVEVDGGIHEMTMERDAERDAVLRAAGYRVVRVSNESVLAGPAAVADAICAALPET